MTTYLIPELFELIRKVIGIPPPGMEFLEYLIAAGIMFLGFAILYGILSTIFGLLRR